MRRLEYGSAIFLESARHGYYLERLVKMAKRTVWTIQKQICKGDFVPKGFETQFTVGDKVRLIGTVDRYDVYDEEVWNRGVIGGCKDYFQIGSKKSSYEEYFKNIYGKELTE